jgi:hypothetical protein
VGIVDDQSGHAPKCKRRTAILHMKLHPAGHGYDPAHSRTF